MQQAEYEIFPVGDQAVTFSLGNAIRVEHNQKVIGMMKWVQQHPFPGLLDIGVAYNSITVVYDLCTLVTSQKIQSAYRYVAEQLLRAYREPVAQADDVPKLKRIPVCYENSFSPDMEDIMALKDLTRDNVIALHSSRDYRVYAIGFLPGFPYMGEVDSLLVLPRRPTPRTRVEAGSVAVAGVQTGIYPVASPGGWHIIGRTPLRLFNTATNPPAILEPGDQVRFYPITATEFLAMNQHGA